jgi:hypothetical protein
MACVVEKPPALKDGCGESQSRVHVSRGHDPTLVRSSITSLAVYDGLLDNPR